MGVCGYLFDDVFREFVFPVSKRSSDDPGGLSSAPRANEPSSGMGGGHGGKPRRSRI